MTAIPLTRIGTWGLLAKLIKGTKMRVKIINQKTGQYWVGVSVNTEIHLWLIFDPLFYPNTTERRQKTALT